ncbi:IS110 family RNA-guided transposase [Alkaliphilus hydrothermalis]|uniref:Transposase n=1 Tax=Alkaliphilus hydrothermalis TaxID=1482730 RepID=A0ABS2NQD7_9FIRM|nr:transposase [Alkaliphilus hydrothermalis]
MSNYYNVPVVGIDVSADFSMVAILAPNGDIYRKPFKINHDASSFNYLLEQIKKVEEEFATKIALFMEATGIYHLTLFYFLQDNEVNSFVINPLVTNCTKNKNIRKVKNDKTDAISIAKLGKYENIKASSWLDTSVYTLRNLWLEYYDLVDSRANLKKKLSSDLRLTFPGYQDGFSDITGNTSLAILEAYSTPETIAKAPKDEVVNLLSTHSRKGILWAQKVYIKLMMATENARAIGVKYVAFSSKIQRYLNLLSANTTEIDTLLNQIKDILTSESLSEAFRQGVKLLTTLSGVGFITAVTIVCEIGDITRFKKSKQLTAFFGIDPSVNQSGKFNSTQNKMSK